MADLREQLAEAIAAERGTAMVQHFDRAYADAALTIVQPVIDTLTAQNAALMAERDAAFNRGLEEAAKVVEEYQCGACETWFHPDIGHYDEHLATLKSDSKEAG